MHRSWGSHNAPANRWHHTKTRLNQYIAKYCTTCCVQVLSTPHRFSHSVIHQHNSSPSRCSLKWFRQHHWISKQESKSEQFYRRHHDHKTSQQHHMVFVIVQRRQRNVFSRPLNALSDKLLSHRVDGELFLTDGPWNAKLGCPVDVLTIANWIRRVDADRSRGRPRTSSTRTQSSCRYAGLAHAL